MGLYAKGPYGVYRDRTFVKGGKEFPIKIEEADFFRAQGFTVREERSAAPTPVVPKQPSDTKTKDNVLDTGDGEEVATAPPTKGKTGKKITLP